MPILPASYAKSLIQPPKLIPVLLNPASHSFWTKAGGSITVHVDPEGREDFLCLADHASERRKVRVAEALCHETCGPSRVAVPTPLLLEERDVPVKNSVRDCGVGIRCSLSKSSRESRTYFRQEVPRVSSTRSTTCISPHVLTANALSA